MKQRWVDSKVDQLMFGIRDHHIGDGAVKLANTYPSNSDKVVQRLQLAVIQPREKKTGLDSSRTGSSTRPDGIQVLERTRSV